MPLTEDRYAPAALGHISHLLLCQGWNGYIVGGFIRDSLLGRETNDVDIAVDAPAATVARAVATETGGTFVLLDESNQIARVILVGDEQRDKDSCLPEWHFDFSTYSGDIESDLIRRDFTINAMALQLSQLADDSASAVARGPTQPATHVSLAGKLIDPFCGQEDLKKRLLRRVSEDIFAADAARLMRAVRLSAELDFAIEPETESLIRAHSQAITRVSGERTREELLRLLTLPGAAHRLQYMDELGLLTALVPELAEARGVEQPTVHYWDVLEHSLQTVAAAEFLMRQSAWQHGSEDMLAVAPWSDTIEEHLSRQVSGGSDHKVLLKLAGLLHDVAKPMTKSVDDTGRARFLGHTKLGAAMTAGILERMRFSNREIRLVESLVYHHLRPAQISDGELPSQRAIYRYFRDTGEAGIDTLLLALADYLASRGPMVSMEEWKDHCRATTYMLEEHRKQQSKTVPVKLVDGHDIMRMFGLVPGPLIGRVLSRVHEAHASGEVNTREEALALVKQELSAKSNQQA